MRSHNRYRCRLYLDDAIADSPLSALVFAGARLRAAAPVLDAKFASAVAGWLPAADVVRAVQPHPVASPAGTGVDQLSGRLA